MKELLELDEKGKANSILHESSICVCAKLSVLYYANLPPSRFELKIIFRSNRLYALFFGLQLSILLTQCASIFVTIHCIGYSIVPFCGDMLGLLGKGSAEGKLGMFCTTPNCHTVTVSQCFQQSIFA